jgi:hypothetical protein
LLPAATKLVRDLTQLVPDNRALVFVITAGVFGLQLNGIMAKRSNM